MCVVKQPHSGPCHLEEGSPKPWRGAAWENSPCAQVISCVFIVLLIFS